MITNDGSKKEKRLEKNDDVAYKLLGASAGGTTHQCTLNAGLKAELMGYNLASIHLSSTSIVRSKRAAGRHEILRDLSKAKQIMERIFSRWGIEVQERVKFLAVCLVYIRRDVRGTWPKLALLK
ncbi:hypothetical protein B0H14DRAFT_2587994 [Mycena olivaceomarginata]|nr:hypothetical protein B0H14DRAFT_2587994 [Mycena olivaceomarginata]